MSGWDFTEALLVEPAFETDTRFHHAFYEFGERLSVLQRYFVFSGQFVSKYLYDSQTSLDGVKSAEEGNVHFDMTASDSDYFTTYLNAATLSHGFALLEALLGDLVHEFEATLGRTIDEVEPRRMPYVNRYISFLRRACEFPDLDKSVWKRLDALRNTRNKYVHELSSDLPEDVQNQLEKILDQIEDQDLSKAAVLESFKTIGSIAEHLQAAYWARVA